MNCSGFNKLFLTLSTLADYTWRLEEAALGVEASQDCLGRLDEIYRDVTGNRRGWPEEFGRKWKGSEPKADKIADCGRKNE